MKLIHLISLLYKHFCKFFKNNSEQAGYGKFLDKIAIFYKNHNQLYYFILKTPIINFF